jgi:NAD(P)-dependent dehydrogenase (short-subunit alcohol dehydrogenase family)
MTDLLGKVAFITGASRDIGAAVTQALSNEGIRPGLARSGDDLGLHDTLGIACDVRHLHQMEAAMAENHRILETARRPLTEASWA